MITSERNHQIVIMLLKHHGIKKIVSSPGATNVSFIASIQNDPYFEIYSSVDERSACYMACGLAIESGEPVVLSCTGATASRNYLPGLTEAFYRKIPVIALTSSQPLCRIGHNFPQVIDRTNVINDVAKISVNANVVKDIEDEWECCISVNKALLELTRGGGGPVHINLETSQGSKFIDEDIKPVQVINRIGLYDKMPILNKTKIVIFVGAHVVFDEMYIKVIESFCEKYNAVVVGDHTSNYKGKYFVQGSVITSQKEYRAKCLDIDLMIHLGCISGSYMNFSPKEVWRVDEDGEICDTFKALRYVFEMPGRVFFERICANKSENNTSYAEEWKNEYDMLISKMPELPYSNMWIASQTHNKLPKDSVLHFGILNSLRSWNYFEIDKSIYSYCNTGGFGIDGCISTVLGASLANNNKLYYLVLGDLAFFYDMNAIGNRHLGNNLRILVVNNGHGQEFRNYGFRANQFGEDTEKYIAASGHFGNKSTSLIKNYAENLGFEYFAVANKDDYIKVIDKFTNPMIGDKPMIVEAFTESTDETEAHKLLSTLVTSTKSGAKKIVKNILGEKGVNKVKNILRG